MAEQPLLFSIPPAGFHVVDGDGIYYGQRFVAECQDPATARKLVACLEHFRAGLHGPSQYAKEGRALIVALWS